MTRVSPVPVLRDNYVWLVVGGDRCAVVDPGEVDPVIRALEAEGLVPEAILVTHHHHDHVAGVEGLAGRFGVPVYGPAAEAIPGRTHGLAGGAGVALDGVGVALEVLEVPGHTRGHIAYFGDGLLLCGDALFAGGCGRLFEGTAEEAYAGLARLAALPGETRVCCGHEYTVANLEFAARVEPDNPAVRERLAAARSARERGEPTVPSTIAEERATNPFLRATEPAVAQAAEARAGRSLDTPEEVFATLRAWKDAA